MSGASATERAELVEVARQFARHELIPRALELDAGDPLTVADRWRRLAQLGLHRALLEEPYGGVGLDERDLLAAIEELAVGDGGIAMCVLLCNAALTVISPHELAVIDESERWVLVPVRPENELTASERGLEVRVASALGAFEADGLVLFSEEMASIAVRGDAPELERRRDQAQMGLRAAPAASVRLSGVTATPPSAHTGTPHPLALLRAGTAAIARGIARRAYELALAYAQERRQGGVEIVEHDGVRDMLAAMAVRIAAPLPPALDGTQAVAAKVAHTDAAVSTTTDAVQVFGGIGYMHETGVEKLMRDAKYCQMFPEPNWLAQDQMMLHIRHPGGRV